MNLWGGSDNNTLKYFVVQILKKCGTFIEIMLFSALSNSDVVLRELKIMCRFDDDDYIVRFSM